MSANSLMDEYDLDPRGDVILLLSTPPKPQNRAEIESIVNGEISVMTTGSVYSPEDDPSTGATVNELSIVLSGEGLDDAVQNTGSNDTAASAPQPTSSEDPISPYDEVVPQIRIRASSIHLRLASSYFDKMFSSDLAEGQALRAQGSVEMSFRSLQNPEAFVTLLQIIHGRTRRVPRKVTSETLADMAVMVDYFDCHEAVEPFTDMWVDGIRDRMPTTFSEDVCHWICIAWVFRKADEFRLATKAAQRGACEPLVCDAYPIPEHVVNSINQSRLTSISQILSILHDRVEYYQGQHGVRCSEECDSMVLGALTRKLRAKDILSWPEVPFSGSSVEDLASWVQQLELSSVHTIEQASSFRHSYDSCENYNYPKKKWSKKSPAWKTNSEQCPEPLPDDRKCEPLPWAKEQVKRIYDGLNGLNINE